jgi:hypothetical protein
VAPRFPVIAAAAAALVLAPSAAADAGLGFGAHPLPKGHADRGYFTYTLEPGGTATDRLVIANTTDRAERLKILISNGATAHNSGDAYMPSSACRDLGCWIHGLPSTFTVAPKSHKTLRFTVSVPAGAARRQYLAGITIRPASTPAPARLSTQNGVGARVVIIRELTVPVAATVGNLQALRSRLVVTGVRASTTTEQIIVTERNVGETFVHARGRAICVAGSRRFAYPLSSSTVLPGSTAQLAVNAPDLVRGTTYRCTATLDFGGAKAASWRGTVTIPKNGPPKVVQTGPHRYSTLPKQGVPRWAIALIAAGAAIVLGLLVVIVVLLRRRPATA